MRSYILKLILIFFSCMPDTRFYKLRSRFLQKLGFNIHLEARLVASVKISGICELHIQEGTFIGHDVAFYGNGIFKIGKNVDVAPQVKFLSGSHMVDMLPTRAAGTGFNSFVNIGDGCWIGAGSIILPGVTIGNGSIIAAGSVVNKDVPEFCLYAGNPAVFKKKVF